MGQRHIKWALAVWITSAGLAPAATISDVWLGSSGNWSNSTAWSGGSPNNSGGNTYAATIASGGTDSITLDVSFTIDSLVIGGTTGSSVAQSGPGSLTLQVNGPLTVNSTGSIALSNADQMTAGSVSNFGSIHLFGGGSSVLNITADLTNAGGIGVDASNTLNIGGTLNNVYNAGTGATVNIAGTANVNALSNAGTLNVNGSLNLTGGGLGLTDIAANSSVSLGPGGAINVINNGVSSSALANLTTVEGQLGLSNGQTTTLKSLTNSGVVRTLGAGTTLAITGDVSNSGGEIGVGNEADGFDSGNMTVTGSLYNWGTASDPGSVLSSAGTTLVVDGTFYNETKDTELSINGDVCLGGLENAGMVIISSTGSLNGSGCAASADETLTEMISSPDTYGMFAYSGPVTLNGTLDVELEDGFIPTVGESFEFITFPAGDLTGTFSGIENDFFNGGTEQWVLTYDNTDGDVLLTAEADQSPSTPEPSTALLMGSSLLAIGFTRLRKRHSAREYSRN